MTKLSFSALPAQPVPGEPISGWECQEFRLLSSRAAEAAETRIEVGQDDVIELVLEDGSSILATEEDLAGYGFRPNRSGDGVEITTALSPPDVATRDGAGRWLLRSLRLWRNPVGAGVHALAGTLQDMKLAGNGTPGWYQFTADAQALGNRLDVLPKTSEPVLLLIHGTISSTAGSFAGLFGPACWPQLRQLYGDRSNSSFSADMKADATLSIQQNIRETVRKRGSRGDQLGPAAGVSEQDKLSITPYPNQIDWTGRQIWTIHDCHLH